MARRWNPIATALLIVGCGGEQTMPKGHGTGSGVVNEKSTTTIPKEITDAKPGSGMGVGGGDGMGRMRNKDGGKADHGRGGGKKKKEQEAKKEGSPHEGGKPAESKTGGAPNDGKPTGTK